MAKRGSTSRPGHSRARTLAFALCALAACGRSGCSGSSEAPAAQPAALERAPEPAPAPAPAPTEQKPAEAAPARGKYPKEGWSKVGLDNAGPLCVFASHEEHYRVQHQKDVKKQTLRAKSTVVFGVFGPWCVNEACDDLPSLQCMVKREGSTLAVRSRYWGYHKDGTTCTETCRPVYAGCETPELEAGTYTVTYGAQSFELKIPSVMRDPCFDVEPAPAPAQAAAETPP